MATVASLGINFTSDMAKVIKDFDRTSKAAKKAATDISGSLDFAKKAIGAFIGYQALKAGASFIHQQMEIIDKNAKMADSFGITTEALARNSLIAKESGISIETLSGAWTKMSKAVYDGARGSKEQADAFKQLGLDAKALINLAPDQQFERIAAALSKLQNPTDRIGAASKIFGKNAREIFDVLNQYPEKLKDAAAFTEKFGLAVSRIDSAKVEEANDAFGRIGIAIGGVAGKIGVELSPMITNMSKDFLGIIPSADFFAKAVRHGIDWIAEGMDGLLDSLKAYTTGLSMTGSLLQGMWEADKAFFKGMMGDSGQSEDIKKIREKTLRDMADIYTDALKPSEHKWKDYVDSARQEAEAAATKLTVNKGNRGSDTSITAAPESFAKGWKDGLEKTKLYINDFASISEHLVVNSFKGMEDALVSFVKTGKVDFKGMIDSMLSDLIRLQIRQSIVKPLFDMMSGGEGGGILGSIGGALSGMFGGGKAAGGPVSAGASYIVGENGPEVLSMGSSSGRITPNHALGGGQTIVNIINNSGAQATQTSTKNSSGGETIDVIIDKMMAQNAGNPSSRFSRTMRASTGISPSLANR